MADPELDAEDESAEASGSETADNDPSDNLSLIEDEETPLANQELEESAVGAAPIVIGVVIAAAAVAVVVYIVISKKRKENGRR